MTKAPSCLPSKCLWADGSRCPGEAQESSPCAALPISRRPSTFLDALPAHPHPTSPHPHSCSPLPCLQRLTEQLWALVSWSPVEQIQTKTMLGMAGADLPEDSLELIPLVSPQLKTSLLPTACGRMIFHCLREEWLHRVIQSLLPAPRSNFSSSDSGL